MTARVDKIVISGVFSLDGQEFDVDNNVWLVGDDRQVIVIDAAHDAEAILAAIGDRELMAVVCTHGHNDHINAAVEVATRAAAPIALHPEDRMLWDAVHPGVEPDLELEDHGVIEVAGTILEVLHTPGHSPGGVCLHAGELGVLFSGDTLFCGGPGATGRSYSDFDTIVGSIAMTLLPLDDATVVHTGHGDDTTIGAEAPHLEEWKASGG